MFFFLIIISGILIAIVGLSINPKKTIPVILIFLFLYIVAENTNSPGLMGGLMGIFPFVLFGILAFSEY